MSLVLNCFHILLWHKFHYWPQDGVAQGSSGRPVGFSLLFLAEPMRRHCALVSLFKQYGTMIMAAFWSAFRIYRWKTLRKACVFYFATADL